MWWPGWTCKRPCRCIVTQQLALRGNVTDTPVGGNRVLPVTSLPGGTDARRRISHVSCCVQGVVFCCLSVSFVEMSIYALRVTGVLGDEV